jgi:hypothetical protein
MMERPNGRRATCGAKFGLKHGLDIGDQAAEVSMASETRIRLLKVGDGPTVDREFWALLDPGATIGMIVDFQRDGRVSQK